MIEPQHLRYFYMVAKNKSFTRAAKEMRISQPAISKMVSQLESLIEKPLFNRINKRPVLTEIGEHFYKFSENLFHELQTLNDFIKAQHEQNMGTIRFGASDNLLNYKLPKILSIYEKKYPKISFQIYSGTSDSIQEQLIQGKLDFGIFYTPPKESNRTIFSSEIISEVEFVLIAPNECHIKTFDIKKLNQELTYVGSRQTDYQKHYPAMKMYQKLGLNPNKFIQTNLQESHKRLVVAGVGWSLLPIHMVEEELKLKKIRRIATPIKLMHPIFLVYLKNTKLNALNLNFMQFLKKII